MSSKLHCTRTHISLLTAFVLSGGISLTVIAEVSTSIVGTDQNSTLAENEGVRLLLSANRGSNGGGDQSLQGGDALTGTEETDLMIGAIGIDILLGNGGDDILIGGTEDFNPLNRDRAFGGVGDDVFLWAPGDGNDFFDGGEGNDVVMFGLIGEQRDADGSSEGAPFFNVNPPSGAGSQDFDGIYVNPSSGLPIMNVAGGPGFCELVEDSANDADSVELAALELDHVVRFILRGPAADATNPDTGLRIALHLNSTEYLVCGGSSAGEIVALDLRTTPATPIDISELPVQAFNLIQQ